MDLVLEPRAWWWGGGRYGVLRAGGRGRGGGLSLVANASGCQCAMRNAQATMRLAPSA
jgi:hypothetical protein